MNQREPKTKQREGNKQTKKRGVVLTKFPLIP
jgi:hypothetical protein